MFQELSSCPAAMEAAKAADCYGLAPGNDTQQADAAMACTQSKLGGVPTCVRLPRGQWPATWSAYRDPVCPLRLALHGHPDAGRGCWEQRCEAHLLKCKFERVADRRSCYWHPQHKVFLVVCVDDYKLGGLGTMLEVNKRWSQHRQPRTIWAVPWLPTHSR